VAPPPAFAYPDEQWDLIRRHLPASLAANKHRAGIELKCRRSLDNAASAFLAYEHAARKRRTGWPRVAVYRNIIRAAERLLAMLEAAPLLVDKTDCLRDLAATATRLAAAAQDYNRSRPRRGDRSRNWYLSMVLNVWRDCGGAVGASVSPSGRGGPLLRFLAAATAPVFAQVRLPPMSQPALRAAVRRIIRSHVANQTRQKRS
jgi:hypothetical protein